MDFTLLPHLTPFIIGFAIMAGLAVLALLTPVATFLAENHAVRVRRHEGIFSYYGHLTLGH